uniref:Protein kinase domain-containing protein n=1 Tax=Mesocestoides corti TaxID=53468 RepID=A0A5K3EV87_MESCO
FRLHSESQGEKRKIPPFSALPDRIHSIKTPDISIPHARAFSTATSQTAPILQGSQQELSPLKTLDLPIYNISTPPRRRPEQRHMRERASYGGTSTAVLFNPDEAFRSPEFDFGLSGTSKISAHSYTTASPVSGSIQSPDNFNIIKSMDEAKKQLSSALMQSKQAVLTWWEKQTTSVARLPATPMSHSRGPSDDYDCTVSGSLPSSAPTSPNYLTNSRERDERDLIECMFNFLIDALNGSDSLQSLNRLFKSAIRNAETRVPAGSLSNRRAPMLGNLVHRISTSFSFDEGHPACELAFVSVVSRILQQQKRQRHQQQQTAEEENGTSEDVVQQLVCFIERAWYALSRTLPKPLTDGGQCQQKPHQMLTWIKLIGDIANEALDQLALQDPSTILRRTKTISAGQRLDLMPQVNTKRARSLKPTLTPSASFSGNTASSPWLPSIRRVQLISPSQSPSAKLPTHPPPLPSSPTDSQLTGADSEENYGRADVNGVLDEPASPRPRTLFGRRMQLRRNAHPPRYVKRNPTTTTGSTSSASAVSPKFEWKHQVNSEVAALMELKRMSLQIIEEIGEATKTYNQLLRSELERKEAYIASLERLAASAAPTGNLDGVAHTYTGISTGFSSLSKWLGELGIPMEDIEIITGHKFDQNDFLELITKEDLWRLGITGGSVLRIWGALCQLRRKFLSDQTNRKPCD